MNLVVKWYRRDVRKQRFQVRYWVVSYIIFFYFNLVEKNWLRVKKISKCAKMASLVYERENCDTATRLTILSVLEPHPSVFCQTLPFCFEYKVYTFLWSVAHVGGWGGGGGVSMINAFRSCFFTYCAPINDKPAGGRGRA